MGSCNAGYQVKFLKESPGYLKCNYCGNVLCKPLLSIQCGHRFCFGCVEMLKQYTIKVGNPLLCPVDRSELNLNEIIEDQTTDKIIQKLPVACKFSDLGCVWKGALETLEAHVGECAFNNDVNENMTTDTLVKKLSVKVEHLQKCIHEKNDEISSLKVAVKKHSEETESLRKETQILHEIINEFKFETENKFLSLNSPSVTQSKNPQGNQDPKEVELKNDGSEGDKTKLSKDFDKDLKSMNEEMLECKNENQRIEAQMKYQSGEIITLEERVSRNERLLCNVKELSPRKTVFLWKLNNFDYHFKKGADVYSPKFYCQPNGKRLLIFIQWKGSKLGVYIKACKGRNDGLITKPFNMATTLSSTSSTGEVAIIRMIPNEDFLKYLTIKPGLEFSEGCGTPEFLTQSKLKNFITNDTLTVTCTLEA